MIRTDVESLACRRSLIAGVVSFFVGFPAVTAVLVYVFALYLAPPTGWLDWVGIVLKAGLVGFVAACGLTIAAMYLAERWIAFRCGGFPCHHCSRRRSRLSAVCPCVRADVPQRRPRHWVHYRRRIKPVLAAYLVILVIVAALLAAGTTSRGLTARDILMAHVVSCALIGVLIHLAESVLEFLHRGRRWRLRANMFLRVFGLWPLLFAFMMMVLKGTGWA